jgi:hypothetical protein
MTFKIFTDAINALEKLRKSIATIANIPKAKRTAYRDAVRDTYSLLDSALNLVSNRLGDLIQLAEQDRKKFTAELRALANEKGWEKIIEMCGYVVATNLFMCGNTRVYRRWR